MIQLTVRRLFSLKPAKMDNFKNKMRQKDEVWEDCRWSTWSIWSFTLPYNSDKKIASLVKEVCNRGTFHLPLFPYGFRKSLNAAWNVLSEADLKGSRITNLDAQISVRREHLSNYLKSVHNGRGLIEGCGRQELVITRELK